MPAGKAAAPATTVVMTLMLVLMESQVAESARLALPAKSTSTGECWVADVVDATLHWLRTIAL
jgi:hypothetical protein